MDHPATSSQITAICAIGIGRGWSPDQMDRWIVGRLGADAIKHGVSHDQAAELIEALRQLPVESCPGCLPDYLLGGEG